jgi:hypothetical protein
MAAQSPTIDSAPDVDRNTGLDCHYVAEQVLRANGTTAPREFVGQLLPNGTLFTIDHAIAVGVYVRDVLDVAKHCSEPLLVEYRTDMEFVAHGVVSIIDAAVYDKASRHITVWDYKNGVTSRDPYYDWQMIGNGLAAWFKYPAAQRLTLRIVQPNCYTDDPIKSWDLETPELQRLGLQMRERATLAQQPDAPSVPGTHCRGCRAAHTCGALAEYNKRMLADMRQMMHNHATPQHMTPMEISMEMDRNNAGMTTLKARKEAQDAYAYQLADKQAVNIPGYKLVSKRAQRRITDASTFVETARTFGYSDTLLYHEPKLLSPVQLESVGVNKELIEMFVEKPEVGKQLVPMSDNRPAIAAELLERFKSVIK